MSPGESIGHGFKSRPPYLEIDLIRVSRPSEKG